VEGAALSKTAATGTQLMTCKPERKVRYLQRIKWKDMMYTSVALFISVMPGCC